MLWVGIISFEMLYAVYTVYTSHCSMLKQNIYLSSLDHGGKNIYLWEGGPTICNISFFIYSYTKLNSLYVLKCSKIETLVKSKMNIQLLLLMMSLIFWISIQKYNLFPNKSRVDVFLLFLFPKNHMNRSVLNTHILKEISSL